MEIILASDPSFSPHNYSRRHMAGLDSTDPMTVAEAVNYFLRALTTEQLNTLFERFGGIEAFTAKKMNDDLKYLRNTLMRAENFSPEVFKEIFDKTYKIGKTDAHAFVQQTYYLTDLEKFMLVWHSNRSQALSGIGRFRPWEAHQKLRERLPMVHAKDCKGDEPGNALAHYYCERPVAYRPDLALPIQMEAKRELQSIIASEVLDFVQTMILGCSVGLRESYAGSLIVRHDHWRELAQDPKRDVLNAVAQNILLPSDIALEIVTSHKTPFLREEIAKRTIDRHLLETIWGGTKSESIREVVESNFCSVRFNLN